MTLQAVPGSTNTEGEYDSAKPLPEVIARGTKETRKPDYLEVTYSEARLPKSDYPARLVRRLYETAYRKPGRLLDVGCGRGEFLQRFADLGFNCIGVDSAESASSFAPGCDVRVLNLDRDPFPFPDESFDFVFSKSVVEHLRNPEAVLAECRRVLKPGGIAVVMTPSWRHQWRIFFEDLGHIRPFGAGALADGLTLAGFKDVRVEYFHQLPSLWAFPPLKVLAKATALLPLPYQPWDPACWPEALNKWIRFSKEIMLLGVATKP